MLEINTEFDMVMYSLCCSTDIAPSFDAVLPSNVEFCIFRILFHMKKMAPPLDFAALLLNVLLTMLIAFSVFLQYSYFRYAREIAVK